jgi:hypothetical protein
VLDVDFAQPAPQLVTALLAASLPERDEQELWSLPVGTRLEYLLALLAFDGERPLSTQRTCENNACGKPIEIELTAAELVALASERDGGEISVDVDGRTIEVRRPTGRDQIAWQTRNFRDEADAWGSLAADLLAGESRAELDDEIVSSIETALEESDPLICLKLDVVCPYCSETRLYELDTLELALARFRERQHRLVADIHSLASHYHWTEAEILAVPAERRERYLALIDRGRG